MCSARLPRAGVRKASNVTPQPDWLTRFGAHCLAPACDERTRYEVLASTVTTTDFDVGVWLIFARAPIGTRTLASGK
jgi:hypothetical protein